MSFLCLSVYLIHSSEDCESKCICCNCSFQWYTCILYLVLPSFYLDDWLEVLYSFVSFLQIGPVAVKVPMLVLFCIERWIALFCYAFCNGSLSPFFLPFKYFMESMTSSLISYHILFCTRFTIWLDHNTLKVFYLFAYLPGLLYL